MNISYGKQWITEEDIKSVIETLKSDFLTQGPKIKELENAFCKLTGSKYAVALSNATVALHLSALALDIKEDDIVITTPITFVATANGPRYCGAKIDFVDINAKTYNLDLDLLEEKLKQYGIGKVKAVYPVSFAGYPYDLEKLNLLASKYKFSIVEDACHAPGAYVNSNAKKLMAGSSINSNMAIFSLHPVKHIAAGEGGIITTNNEEVYKRLISLRSHGIVHDSESFQNKSHGPWYHEMQELGYNYRITDIQAALAVSQMNRLEDNLKRRQEIAKKYDSAFTGLNIITPYRSEDIYHAFHLYVIQTEKRNELYAYLRENNVYSQVHYIPVHTQPYYVQLNGKVSMPIAEDYYSKCLTLPIYHALTDEQQDKVIALIKKFFSIN